MNNKYQEALNRLQTINLDIIEDGETRLNQSVYGIHDYANFELKADLITIQEAVTKALLFDKEHPRNNSVIEEVELPDY